VRTTGLSPGKTVWSTSPPAWSGSFSSQPSCCSNEGVICGTAVGTTSYVSVQSITLNYLGLSGTLPSEIGYFRSVQNFVMGTNAVSGSIPSTIGTMTNMQYFDLGYNSMFGSIPSSISNMQSLSVLLIRQQAHGHRPVKRGTPDKANRYLLEQQFTVRSHS
jgi:hypothetical protein